MAGRWLHIDPTTFREKFNKHHFTVTHELASHPLFQLPRLIELARDTAKARPSDMYFDDGEAKIDSRWRQAPSSLPVDDTIARIRDAGAFVILKRADSDPAYASLLAECMGDILELSGPQLEAQMRRREVIVFITSPNRLTPYHIDSECNFLLQVHGDKQIYMYDRADREVVTEEELERFWTVDINAGKYRPEMLSHADPIMMHPGTGVHIPVNAPHWLQNGNDISVSVSINYHTRYRDYLNLYTFNYYERRKLGLNPTPPFQSRWRDTLKQPIGAALTAIRHARYGPVRKP